MDRVKQVEAIQSYNSMKANLMEYLKKFAQSGKVVREEDVKEFFEQMKSVKRPRLEIPDNCRQIDQIFVSSLFCVILCT